MLQLFTFQADFINAELLNITQEGEQNAILLAISVILQGYQSVGELSQLLSNIAVDLREDGTLDDSSMGSKLMRNASNLKLDEIQKNIQKEFALLSADYVVPNFQQYIEQFKKEATFINTSGIEYPERNEYGDNVVYPERTILLENETYSLAANVPNGEALTIRIRDGLWYFQLSPNGPVNWKVSEYNFETQHQTFTVQQPGNSSDLIITFDSDVHYDANTIYIVGNDTLIKDEWDVYKNGKLYDTIHIDFFENNNTDIPSYTRELLVEPRY